eukprot:3293558-Prymnesium_polylepis.1
MAPKGAATSRGGRGACMPTRPGQVAWQRPRPPHAAAFCTNSTKSSIMHLCARERACGRRRGSRARSGRWHASSHVAGGQGAGRGQVV